MGARRLLGPSAPQLHAPDEVAVCGSDIALISMPAYPSSLRVKRPRKSVACPQGQNRSRPASAEAACGRRSRICCATASGPDLDVAIELPARKLSYREGSSGQRAIHLGAAAGATVPTQGLCHPTTTRPQLRPAAGALAPQRLLSLGVRNDRSFNGFLTRRFELRGWARSCGKSSILRMPPLRRTTSGRPCWIRRAKNL